MFYVWYVLDQQKESVVSKDDKYHTLSDSESELTYESGDSNGEW